MIIVLIISLLFNIFFIWYVYQVMKKLLFVSENIGDLVETLEDYASHVEKVYSLETYYGDETIENLLEHSKGIVKEVRTYRDINDILYDAKTEEPQDYDGKTTAEE